jgi:6-phosphogluconate dehydrogenase
MQIGYIGLGRMGLNMVRRLVDKGHDVVAYDVDPGAVRRAVKFGARGARSIEELVESLSVPRLIWVMVPHAHVGDVMSELAPMLSKGDVVIDGGNSPYAQSVVRARALAERGVGFLDVGVSGGPEGALNGACLMVGGPKGVFSKVSGLLEDLAVPEGVAHVGPSGAGHYVKMVHNGIEYGMMQAIAEGFDVLRAKQEFKVNLKEAARIYQRGSVIESRLVGWLHSAFAKFGSGLKGVSEQAVGTGEGKWTVEEAKKLGVSVDVIRQAVKARARTKGGFQGKVVMALRGMFGGHDVKGPSLKKN